MKERIEALIEGRRLTTEGARSLMREALSDPVNPPMVAAFLTALRTNGVTVDALDGFCQAVTELAVPLDLGADDCIDVCGTGGDNKGTFNISTTTAFILAAAGYKVTKHGNYAVSSSCGSSNVLEALGISFESDQEKLRKRLSTANVCFLHAPLFHPAMKRVAPIRKELGFRTIFNILGPLVNPARPEVQVNGVYDRETLRLYSYLLKRKEKRFATLCTLDGYDEVTLTAPLVVASHRGEFELSPSDFGLSEVNPGDITGGQTLEESALIVRRVLQGKGPESHQNVVAASAGLAMWTHDKWGTLREHVARAHDIVRSGAGEKILERSAVPL